MLSRGGPHENTLLPTKPIQANATFEDSDLGGEERKALIDTFAQGNTSFKGFVKIVRFSASMGTEFTVQRSKLPKKIVVPDAKNGIGCYVTDGKLETLRIECLDDFMVCGKRHRWHLVALFVKFYNTLPPHWGSESRTFPEASEAHDVNDEPVILKFPTVEREHGKAAQPPVEKIKPHKFLGGLLSHYERVAA